MISKSDKKGIQGSAIFMVLGTENYFANILKEQVMYAKGIKKPFRVLKQAGLVIPKWFKEGATDYKELEVEDFNKLMSGSSDVLTSFLKV